MRGRIRERASPRECALFFRGQDLGRAFVDAREAHARKLDLTHSAFCPVVRAPDDPRRPPDYRPLDEFWTKRHYRLLKGVAVTFSWAGTGDGEDEIDHMLQFWMRDL